MARSSALAYERDYGYDWDWESSAARELPRELPERRPRFRVMPGGRAHERVEPVLGVWHSIAFRVACIVAAFLACTALVCVWFSAATVTTLSESRNLTSQIEAAYQAGDELEVQRSILASPSRVQSIASERLGMVPASSVSYMDLDAVALGGADVGAVDATSCSLAYAVDDVQAASALAG